MNFTDIPEIKIFACDHRKHDRWLLPYIRLGNKCNINDCAINICNDNTIYDYEGTILSEFCHFQWIYNNLAQFGKTDYLGICHYRRFFTLQSDRIVKESSDDICFKYALTPSQQLAIILNSNVDGILQYQFQDVPWNGQYDNVIEQMALYCKQCGSSLTLDFIQQCFEIYKLNLPPSLSAFYDQALKIRSIYHSNMFTAKTQMFKDLWQILQPTIEQCLKLNLPNNLPNRWLAQCLEQMTSLTFHLFELSKKYKFTYLPIIVRI